MTDAQRRAAAKQFAADWAGKGYEKGHSQTFWLSLLQKVYGVSEPDKFINFEDQIMLDHTSFIDGYIPSTQDVYKRQGKATEIIESCGLDTGTFSAFKGPWGIFSLCRTEDIDDLMSVFDVTRLHLVASDGYTNHIRETIDNMDDGMYELYLKYHLAVCERRDMLGISHHTLDIFRKD